MREKRAPRKRFRGAKINPDVLSGGQMLCRNGLKINSDENISAEKTAEPHDRVRARMKMAEMDRHQVRYRSRKSQYLMKNQKIGMKQIESMRLARIEISPYNSARIDTVGRALFSTRGDGKASRPYRISDQYKQHRVLRRPVVCRAVCAKSEYRCACALP
ncbi:hypothetical protein GWK53_00825 [Burkholderia cepacia]|uniref:hypothetical protein n=1 Tax=Burkholderia cepacia TaxID=292 RepID=UPI0013F45512|nr:hypothetical protein [Burkholderia cepacia]NHB05054.1 hypothetical protein [Burkholderia cepacia]